MHNINFINKSSNPTIDGDEDKKVCSYKSDAFDSSISSCVIAAPRNTVLPSGAQRGLLYLHDKLILHDLLTSKPCCSVQPVHGVKKPPVPLKLYR